MSLLKVVIMHFVASLEVIALYVVYHHVLTIEQLDNELAVLRVGVYAADIIVRDPYRAVVFLGTYNKIPRAYLVPHHRKLIRNIVDNLLKKLLLVLLAEHVKPSSDEGEQQDDENHDE